jgi:hypothetical protein
MKDAAVVACDGEGKNGLLLSEAAQCPCATF